MVTRYWTHPLAPGHVGGLIGLVPCAEGPYRFGDDYRELTAADRRVAGSPARVQIGCFCGWRSPRWESREVCWQAGQLDAPAEVVAECWSAWRIHALAEVAAHPPDAAEGRIPGIADAGSSGSKGVT